ncbi:MAG: PleD family two-component system response regulator [Candidatus Odinarchaeota archaeon]
MEKGIERDGVKPVILLVEDDEDLLHNTEMILAFNGYQVIIITNGKEALQKLVSLQQPPDLVISDIIIPEMNGYDLFKELSRHPQWHLVPFIFMTAKSSPEEVRFGKTLGADDYLTKPFVEEDLLATVAGKIARNRKHRAVSNQIRENLLASLQLDHHPPLPVDMKSRLPCSWWSGMKFLDPRYVVLFYHPRTVKGSVVAGECSYYQSLLLGSITSNHLG